MEIMVNDKPLQFDGERLGDLLKQLNVDRPYIAVAVNDEIVPRDVRDEASLKQGDKIVIVQAVGGG